METQSPSQKGGGAPKFSAHVHCGQTAGWIKMPLGPKVGLSPGDSVLDGDQPSPHEGGGASSPIFGPFLLWLNLKMPLGMEVVLSPGDFGLDGDPPHLPKGRRRPGAKPPNFRPIFIAAKRLDASGCHLVRRYASAYAILCSMWAQLLPEKGHTHPT